MRLERASTKHLGELLIERGIITRQQVETTLEHQRTHPGVLFGETLITLGYATEEHRPGLDLPVRFPLSASGELRN
jgi:hypothetical protein